MREAVKPPPRHTRRTSGVVGELPPRLTRMDPSPSVKEEMEVAGEDEALLGSDCTLPAVSQSAWSPGDVGIAGGVGGNCI
jgi:hypothetical protein